MSPAAAPFRFDLDLGHRQERSRVVTDTTLEEMLKSARMDGFAEGYAEGERGVVAASSRKLAGAADALADRAAGMMTLLEDARHNAAVEGAELAVSVARKLALNLIARQPAAELEALIAECLSSLEGVPHLVIRCNPALAEEIQSTTEARMAISGYTGRLVVLPDPDVALSDGSIEWADGGLVRNLNEISARVDAAVSAYLNPRSADSSQETAR